MKLNKTLTIAALLAGSLLTAGNLLAQDAPKDKPPSAAGGPSVRGRGLAFDAIAAQLKLTDEQKPKVKPVIEEMQQKNRELRTDTALTPTERRAKMKEIHDAATTKLKDILTAEQLADWEKMGVGNRRPPGGAVAPPKADAAPKADTTK